jgi:hypothetical protein
MDPNLVGWLWLLVVVLGVFFVATLIRVGVERGSRNVLETGLLAGAGKARRASSEPTRGELARMKRRGLRPS